MTKTKKPSLKVPGPKPKAVKIGIKGQDAVKQSLQKKGPGNGWPN